MRLTRLVVCFSLLAVSLGFGQWFEGWIPLPDSLKGATPGCLVLDSATHTVWVGGRWSDRLLAINTDSNKVVASVRLPDTYISYLCCASKSHTVFGSMADRDTVVVVDCPTHTVAAFIPVVNPDLLFYSPTFNKMYCACDSGVAIIDAATNQVIRTVQAGGSSDFCEDTKDGWIYCAPGGSHTIGIIDGAADSVVARITTGFEWPVAVCYSSKSDRVYCAYNYADTVLVVHRDTVLDTIRVGQYPVDICYNPVNDKAYVANWSSGSVSVIRCASNQVEATVSTGGDGYVICYDSSLNRLYCPVDDSIAVLNCVTNWKLAGIPTEGNAEVLLLNQSDHTLYYPRQTQESTGVQVTSAVTRQPVAFVPTLGSEHPKTVCWNSVRNKLYVACQGEQQRIGVVDGSTGNVLGWVHTGIYPCALAYDPVLDRIYCAESGSASVSVVDCAKDSAIASVRVGELPVALLSPPGVGKVYCANRVGGTVSVIDASTNQVTRTIQTGGTAPCALSYSPLSGKLYCLNGGSHNISVIAQSSDSLLRLVSVGTNPVALAYSSGKNRLYCVNQGASVTAIECRNDSVLATIGLEGAYGIGYDVNNDAMYCSRCYNVGRLDCRLGIAIIDCGSNVTTADFELPNGRSQSGDSRLEFGYNAYSHKMYCRSYVFADGGYVYACSGSSVLMSFYLGGFGGGFAWNERQNRMYLACDDDSRIAVFRDYGGGIEDDRLGRQPSGLRQMATVARGVLFLPAATSTQREVSSILLDISGRQVMSLHPGPNDVRQLPAGVYFVLQASGNGPGASGVRKVVVSR